MYREKYIKCDCVGECSVLKVTEVPMYNMDEKVDYEILMSIYKKRCNKFSFIHKLKLIWHIIKYGEPYDDDIVISREDAVSLYEWLIILDGEYENANGK